MTTINKHLTFFFYLLQLRNLVMFILTFSGFLRSSELCVIRSRDVQFNEGYVKISIEKSKTDQLREGRSVVIAESSSITCPCSLLKLYMLKAQITENSDEYLFRAISASGNQKRLISINKPISYCTYRQSFKKSFANIVPDISLVDQGKMTPTTITPSCLPSDLHLLTPSFTPANPNSFQTKSKLNCPRVGRRV